MRKVPFEVAQIDYQWTNEHIKLLTDIRFRLLTIATPLVGVAVTLLSSQTVASSTSTPAPSAATATLTAAVGIFGFILTWGVVLYDLRNSQLYNALVHRAKLLERVLGCVGSGHESIHAPGSVPRRASRFVQLQREGVPLVGMFSDQSLAFVGGPHTHTHTTGQAIWQFPKPAYHPRQCPYDDLLCAAFCLALPDCKVSGCLGRGPPSGELRGRMENDE